MGEKGKGEALGVRSNVGLGFVGTLALAESRKVTRLSSTLGCFQSSESKQSNIKQLLIEIQRGKAKGGCVFD
jgi:hypothetical protein